MSHTTILVTTFDEKADPKGKKMVCLWPDSIRDIIDHASRVVVMKRDGQDVSQQLAELEEALTTAGVLDENR